ncbi:short-chain dehydrogenase [Botrytis cinerea]
MATSETQNKSTYAVDMVKRFSQHADGKTFLITGPSEEGIGAEIALSIASSSNPSMIILAAAENIKKLKPEKIHVVINNAGVMGVQNYTTSKQGVEGQFAANYLGHFLLTNLLIDRIEGKAYNAWKALGQSKTAMLLWNIALGKRLADKGVSTFVVHPGTTLETKYLENSGVDQEQLAEAYKFATEREEGK